MKLSVLASAAATLVLVEAAGVARAADGQAVYKQHCAMCHTAVPPKLGDKAAWAPLIKKGTSALVASTLKGKGGMPPQGGKPGMSDADVQAAVEYMESKSR